MAEKFIDREKLVDGLVRHSVVAPTEVEAKKAVQQFYTGLPRVIGEFVGTDPDQVAVAEEVLSKTEYLHSYGDLGAAKDAANSEMQQVDNQVERLTELADAGVRFGSRQVEMPATVGEAWNWFVYTLVEHAWRPKLPFLPHVSNPGQARLEQARQEQETVRAQYEQILSDHAEAENVIKRIGEFEAGLDEGIRMYALGDYQLMAGYGLIFWVRRHLQLPTLLTDYGRRILHEPTALELGMYLKWLIEKAQADDEIGSVMSGLPRSGLLGGDLRIAREIVEGLFTAPDLHKASLQTATWILEQELWGTQRSTVRHLRNNCAEYLQRTVADVWERNGVYQSHAWPVELPYGERRGASQARMVVENGEAIPKGPLWVHLKGIEKPFDADELLDKGISPEDLGITEEAFPRGSAVIYEHLLSQLEGLRISSRPPTQDHLRSKPQGYELRFRAGHWRVFYNLKTFSGGQHLNVLGATYRDKETYTPTMKIWWGKPS